MLENLGHQTGTGIGKLFTIEIVRFDGGFGGAADLAVEPTHRQATFFHILFGFGQASDLGIDKTKSDAGAVWGSSFVVDKILPETTKICKDKPIWGAAKATPSFCVAKARLMSVTTFFSLALPNHEGFTGWAGARRAGWFLLTIFTISFNLQYYVKITNSYKTLGGSTSTIKLGGRLFKIFTTSGRGQVFSLLFAWPSVRPACRPGRRKSKFKIGKPKMFLVKPG